MTPVFEHKIVTFGLGWKGFDHDEMERRLTELGGQGWEAVSSLQPSVGAAPTDILVLLKRAR
jgi:hypothetical protein